MTARTDGREALVEQLLVLGELLASAPGCELFLVARSPTSPVVVWVTEVWSSADDHFAANALPDVADRVEAARALLVEQPTAIELVPCAGWSSGWFAGRD